MPSPLAFRPFWTMLKALAGAVEVPARPARVANRARLSRLRIGGGVPPVCVGMLRGLVNSRSDPAEAIHLGLGYVLEDPAAAQFDTFHRPPS